jgi:hypothetical protein
MGKGGVLLKCLKAATICRNCDRDVVEDDVKNNYLFSEQGNHNHSLHSTVSHLLGAQDGWHIFLESLMIMIFSGCHIRSHRLRLLNHLLGIIL